MIAGIAHDLRRRVKPHGLRIEQGSTKYIGMMALHPGGGVGDQRKGRRVAFGETIAAKALDLGKKPLGKCQFEIIAEKALDQSLFEIGDRPDILECRHGPPQLVCLTGRKTGTFNGKPHRMLLKERHAERLFQNLFECGVFVLDCLTFGQLLAPFEVGMHHIALNGPRADDRHLNDEIVKHPWLEARQHGHLRPAFDLERADRVSLADHVIGWAIIWRDSGQIDAQSLVMPYHVERTAHARKHAERQAVHLHELNGFDVVLVPFDDPPVIHGRRQDGHEFVQPVMRQNETARMLAVMARRADQLPGQIEHQPDTAILQIDVKFGRLFFANTFRPPPDLRGHQLGQIFRQAEHLADVANGALAAIPADDGAECGLVMPIALVNPLDDVFPPLVLEIDVDIGRFVPVFGDEPFEQQVMAIGIDRGNPQHIADGGIGGGAPPLAEDFKLPRFAHDSVDGEEIGRISKLCDQRQFVLQNLFDARRHPGWIALWHLVPNEFFQ